MGDSLSYLDNLLVRTNMLLRGGGGECARYAFGLKDRQFLTPPMTFCLGRFLWLLQIRLTHFHPGID